MSASTCNGETVREILRKVIDTLRPDLQSCTTMLQEAGVIVIRLESDLPYKYALEIPQPVPDRESVEAEILRFLQFAAPRELRQR
jgi:hypothetical protein